MIVNLWHVSDLKKTIEYIGHREKPAGKTFELLDATVATSRLSTTVNDFVAVTKCRHGVAKPYLHFAIAVRRGKFERKVWRRIARRMMQLMGIDAKKHAWYSGLHADSERDHCHLLVSRVRIDGLLHDQTFDLRRAIDAARQLSREFEIADDESVGMGEHYKVVRINRMLDRAGLPLVVGRRVTALLSDCLRDSRDLNTFVERAASLGLQIERRFDATGRQRGLCLVVKVPGERRLALSHVTRSLFSGRTLREFFCGKGVLVTHLQSIIDSERMSVSINTESDYPDPDPDPNADDESWQAGEETEDPWSPSSDSAIGSIEDSGELYDEEVYDSGEWMQDD